MKVILEGFKQNFQLDGDSPDFYDNMMLDYIFNRGEIKKQVYYEYQDLSFLFFVFGNKFYYLHWVQEDGTDNEYTYSYTLIETENFYELIQLIVTRHKSWIFESLVKTATELIEIVKFP